MSVLAGGILGRKGPALTSRRSTAEVRPLRSGGITRPPRYYGPLRLPRRASRAGSRGCPVGTGTRLGSPMVHVERLLRMLCLLRRGAVLLRPRELQDRGLPCPSALHPGRASPVPQQDVLAFAIERETRHSQFPPQGGKVGVTTLHLASHVLRPADSRRDTEYPIVGKLRLI